ncbi:MAG: hypothetical protein ABIG32_03330 [Candidatus Uhrbacteria bacterium]|nr:DUF4178 domain-containing protein [Patescibacteria group bacterium]MBU1906599.1 DUF4178 domain-containing protein [Patescibacteria group bacterium]
MSSEDILKQAEIGQELSVLNSPFLINGRITITLEGGVDIVWIFSDDEKLLAVNATTDEMILLSPVEDEIDGDDEDVAYHGKQYEFSYEDNGMISEGEDGANFDVGEKVSFKDFESEDGQVVRLINTSGVEDQLNYAGQALLDDDIVMT